MKLFGIAVLFALMGLVPGGARAGLEICNDTQAKQTVAIGYKSGNDWVSEGWWNIDAGDCKMLVGGDLKQRYYYYLSKSSGWEFADENIVFCTTSDEFTIVGDENCPERGYEKGRFRKIDTGKTAKEFTQFLSSYSARTAPAPAPPASSEPGTWGEPYASGTAIFQSCEFDTEATFCSFHDNGYKFFVYDDGRTPDGVMRRLRGYSPGTPIDVQGDLESVYDRTADLVMRAVLPRPWNSWDSALGRMQGQWYSQDDPASMFTVLGSERINTYDGTYSGIDYLSLGRSCDVYEDNDILTVRDESSGDTLCYSIEEQSDWEMTWMYLPRANFHTFRKLD
jgi:uncharacterized membrane protein